MFFESICLVLYNFQANKLMCFGFYFPPNCTICLLQPKHNLLEFLVNPPLPAASSWCTSSEHVNLNGGQELREIKEQIH